MKTIFSRDIQLFGQPVRLLGASRPVLRDVTSIGPSPDASPPPPRELAALEQEPHPRPQAYPGRSPFSGPCPVCR